MTEPARTSSPAVETQQPDRDDVLHSDVLDTVVVGAGQAGLSVAYHLARTGRRFVVLDGARRIGDGWRSHWDSLRLYSAARYDGLPGMPFPAPPWSWPTKDDMAEYLETYARHFDLPVRGGSRVRRLGRDGHPQAPFRVECEDAEGTRSVLRAASVVVATGTFGRTPAVPEVAADLDPAVLQLHSSEYRNPDSLRSGPVLVVGASHSGADIAFELAAGRSTTLCGRDRGQLPFRIEGPSGRVGFPLMFWVGGHLLTLRTPAGQRMREHERVHGAPLIRYRRADLAAAGVERVPERVVSATDGLPTLESGRVLDVANVVWCTGFRQDLGWVDLPVLGEDGWPLERRGVVESVPGLYFCGLAFQSSFRSMLVGGAGDDARYVVRHLTRHVAPVAARTAVYASGR